MLEQLYQYLRRRYLLLFKKDYINKSLENRKGECNNCGCCDSIKIGFFKFKCKYFKNGECSIYDTDKMPYLCRIYPIDEKDKWGSSKEGCGYYWEI